MSAPRRLIMGVTGASGAVYAERALRLLAETEIETHLAVSSAAGLTFLKERGRTFDPYDFAIEQMIGRPAPNIVVHDSRNIGASIASGSFQTMGMMILPCSMGTVGALAAGLSLNLIHRAADVCIKERRKLVIAPRETPLSTIHLENLTRLSRMGAVILPAMPGFYHLPKTLDDQIHFVLAKLFDQFNLEFDLMNRWEG